MLVSSGLPETVGKNLSGTTMLLMPGSKLARSPEVSMNAGSNSQRNPKFIVRCALPCHSSCPYTPQCQEYALICGLVMAKNDCGMPSRKSPKERLVMDPLKVKSPKSSEGA